MFEAVDVISLIRDGNYDDLNLSVGEALQRRNDVCKSLNRFEVKCTNNRLGFPRNLHLLD